MFLSVHTSFTLLLGSRWWKINFWLAFIVGVLSHFVLDFIPHGDESLVLTWLILAVDVLFACLLIFWYFKKSAQANKWVLLVLVLSSWVPDAMRLVPIIFDWHFMDWLIHFHDSIHNYFDISFSMLTGLAAQGIFILIFMSLAWNHKLPSNQSFKIVR